MISYFKFNINKKHFMLFIFLGIILLFGLNQAKLLTTTDIVSQYDELNEVYIEKDSGWRISYPSNMKLSSAPVEERVSDPRAIDNAVDFWIAGSTQRSGTELYDGLRITIFNLSKNPDMSLKELANEKSKSYHSNEIYPINEVTINNIHGYQFYHPEYGGVLSTFLPYMNNEDKVLIIEIVSKGKLKKDYDKIYKGMLKSFNFL